MFFSSCPEWGTGHAAVFACWRRRPAGQRSCRLQPLQLHQSWSGGSSSSWSCRAGIKASSAPSKRPERDHHIFPQAPPPWPELVVQGHGTDQRATGQTPRSKRMEWDGSVAGHCSEITHSLALFSLKWAAESDVEDHVAVYAVTCCRSYLLTMIKVSRPKFD